MKLAILAGGVGTRVSEETDARPKPRVEIGGRPIVRHIMKIYSAHGIHEFIICLGYKGYMIKEYFARTHLSHAALLCRGWRSLLGDVNCRHVCGRQSSFRVGVLPEGLGVKSGLERSERGE